MTYQDRTLRVHPSPPDQLVASLHGVVNADTAQGIADRLLALRNPPSARSIWTSTRSTP